MDVTQKLDEIVDTVRGAKSMPMSASCVIHRADLLARLDEVREALPGSLARAQEVLGDREAVVADAQQEAQRILQAAHAERGSLVESTEIVQRAQAEAAQLLERARQEADAIKAEADDYVDSKLANFEVVLGKTIGSVERGRDKLLGPDRNPGGDLPQQADAYVEAQFAAIEAVLRKTLAAVGRGRQKLTGHRPIDELAEHVAQQESAGTVPAAGAYYSADADQDTYGYLGMTAPAREPAGPGGTDGGAPGGYPAQPDGPAPYAAQDTAAYAQDGGYAAAAQGGGYGQDPYGAGGGYPQDDGYGGAGGAQAPGYGGYPQSAAGYQGPGTLEETSLFDTGMIDPEQLRRYEQGRS
ncbi:ATP synthase F0 subunit B [Streptomyces sp. NPDC059853]|uniref:ATP synthase F0 subunit B n=1 Tax=Streptomyces sp. NPDC059853 TaxID=3346973 RepID=UPI00364DDDA0